MATRLILAAAFLIPLLADSASAQRGGPGGRSFDREEGDDEGRGRGGFGRGGFDRGGFDRGDFDRRDSDRGDRGDRQDRGDRGRDRGDSERFRGRFGGEDGEGGRRGFGDRGGPGGFGPGGLGRPPGGDYGGRGFGGPGGGFGGRGFGDRERDGDSEGRDFGSRGFGRGGFNPEDRSRGFDRSSPSDSRRSSPAQEKSRPARKPREPVTVTLPDVWTQYDVDQDGQLGLYEWPRDRRRELLQYDTNGDGFLTPRELTGAPAPQIARAE